MLLTIVLIIIGILIVVLYKKLFKQNVSNVLSNQEGLKLPDLKDVIISYLILCLIIAISVSLNKVGEIVLSDISECYKVDVTISTIDSKYEVCINKYNNPVFVDSKESYRMILEDYQSLMDDITLNGMKVSTDTLDNIYYGLQNNRRTDEDNELYDLLRIYLNRYETEYVSYHEVEGE